MVFVYILGVLTGIAGILIWAVLQMGGIQSEGEEAVEKCANEKAK